MHFQFFLEIQYKKRWKYNSIYIDPFIIDITLDQVVGGGVSVAFRRDAGDAGFLEIQKCIVFPAIADSLKLIILDFLNVYCKYLL